ncbi:MAG TPA: argininosuccinate lyase, partial [Chthoniobacterales bacterium]|nr:argininosuccinate lyase [Chthoniobacterales bacterium]
REIEIEPDRMLKAASDPSLLATDLADYLVKRGVPFRQAHEIIGKLVAFSIQHQRPFPQLTLVEYRQFSDRFDEDVFEVLNLRNALGSRTAIGAPSPKNVAAELEAWNAKLRE